MEILSAKQSAAARRTRTEAITDVASIKRPTLSLKRKEGWSEARVRAERLFDCATPAVLPSTECIHRNDGLPGNGENTDV
jgi:hypothetical protein